MIKRGRKKRGQSLRGEKKGDTSLNQEIKYMSPFWPVGLEADEKSGNKGETGEADLGLGGIADAWPGRQCVVYN
jgi:hypothetical protein